MHRQLRQKYGTIKYTYSTAADGEYSEIVPTDAGTYYVKAKVEETDKYTGLESDAVEFECKDDKEARALGIEWCINQCRELIAYGVPGIHFYTVGAVDNVKEVATAVY